MDLKLMLAGALLCLLIFGCVGGGWGQGGASQKAPVNPSGPGSAGIKLGDSDISQTQGADQEDLLPSGDLLPPPDDAGTAGAEATGTGSVALNAENASGIAITEADLTVTGDINEQDLISDSDVVEGP